jgi:formylglycine-generating enzyme required for sulfatase activity
MVFVKGGTFTMGCGPKDGDCEKDEKPPRGVTVGDYHIGKYPVTQKQWIQVMGANPSHFKGDNLPVGKVSWHDAQEFISRQNRTTGKTYRLPTEAEWEYAARGGAKGTGFAFAGSNNIGDVAWYKNNSGGSWPYEPQHCRVSYRNGSAPGNRGADVGFRLAMSP